MYQEPGPLTSTLYLQVKTPMTLGFQFDINMAFALREVELYLFFCPSWGIPQESLTISVYRSLLFPELCSSKWTSSIR